MAALTRSLRALRPATSVASRAIQTLSFGGTEETIIERSDYPKAKIAELFADDTVAMLGYGTQGRGQALNARDSGVAMTIGLREGGASWKLAMEDGFVPGETLFSVEKAAKRGTVIMYLLSDAGQVRAPPLCAAAAPARHPRAPARAHSRLSTCAQFLRSPRSPSRGPPSSRTSPRARRSTLRTASP